MENSHTVHIRQLCLYLKAVSVAHSYKGKMARPDGVAPKARLSFL